jgi:hypothetical protein
MMPCGHYFLDEFKWEAYARLRRHFCVDSERHRLLVEEVLRIALESTDWAWEDFHRKPIFHSTGPHYVRANPHTLEAAFRALMLTLSHSIGYGSQLELTIGTEDGVVRVAFRALGAPEGIRGAMDHYRREAEQLLVENGASLKRESTAEELRWIVRL